MFEVIDNVEVTHKCGHKRVIFGGWSDVQRCEQLECPDCLAAKPKPGLPLDELKVKLSQLGYTHFLDMNLVAHPLAEWDPYGMNGPNRRPNDPLNRYRGEIITREGETKVRDVPDHPARENENLYLGAWSFSK